MRKLQRDLVLILRTEAKNQRTPPIDYVIAEDGGRMVHTPEPDIAMAELLEEAASALAAKDAQLAAVEALAETNYENICTIQRHLNDATIRAERAEAQLAEKDKEIAALRKKANDWSMEADKYKRALDRCQARNAGGKNAE